MIVCGVLAGPPFSFDVALASAHCREDDSKVQQNPFSAAPLYISAACYTIVPSSCFGAIGGRRFDSFRHSRDVDRLGILMSDADDEVAIEHRFHGERIAILTRSGGQRLPIGDDL